jgi:hypothetical protein
MTFYFYPWIGEKLGSPAHVGCQQGTRKKAAVEVSEEFEQTCLYGWHFKGKIEILCVYVKLSRSF